MSVAFPERGELTFRQYLYRARPLCNMLITYRVIHLHIRDIYRKYLFILKKESILRVNERESCRGIIH